MEKKVFLKKLPDFTLISQISLISSRIWTLFFKTFFRQNFCFHQLISQTEFKRRLGCHARSLKSINPKFVKTDCNKFWDGSITIDWNKLTPSVKQLANERFFVSTLVELPGVQEQFETNFSTIPVAMQLGYTFRTR